VAPVITVVLIWLHAWTAARYGDLIAAVDDSTALTRHHGAPSDRADVPRARETRTDTDALAAGADAAPVDLATRGSAAVDTHLTGENNVDTNDAERAARIARELVTRRMSLKSEHDIARILELHHRGVNPNRIAARLAAETHRPWARSTVDRILDKADALTTTGDDAVA
jgi:hypothetical protein